LRLVLCYAAFGFGYIIPATFIPAYAREMLADPAMKSILSEYDNVRALFNDSYELKTDLYYTESLYDLARDAEHNRIGYDFSKYLPTVYRQNLHTPAFRGGSMAGSPGLGHTRMATESAVTPEGCHPFSVGPDQCLVHNGSFANHATIRRELQHHGVVFDSENDSEVGARFVASRLAQGEDLDKALRLLCERFDGFYTLLVTSADGFAVVRDAIACKPAIIAETDAWVAMASEFRALAELPGIEDARIYEPEPERVYAWTR
jgi:asparagine synthetase B (glutamine-hydrolysing)